MILVRHGSTDWNAGRFMTGWANPALNATGREEARRAAGRLRVSGVLPSHVVASRCDRTVDTARVILQTLGLPLGVQSSWQLNERHLGALQGLDRAAATLIYGRERLREWKRQPYAIPPLIEYDDPRHSRHDSRYVDVEPRRLPCAESEVQMRGRILNAWTGEIEPRLAGGATVLVVGHCHSLRALVTFLEGPPSRAASCFASPGDLMIYTRRGQTWNLVPERPSPAR